MNTNIETARIASVERQAEQAEPSDATRISQYSFLSEMPGLVFGALTLAWIVMSLSALA